MVEVEIEQVQCTRCHGYGYTESATNCTKCEGLGAVDESEPDDDDDIHSLTGKLLPCSTCSGLGYIWRGDFALDCPECGGLRVLDEAPDAVPEEGKLSFENKCPRCRGYGSLVKRAFCDKCNGTGKIGKEKVEQQKRH